MYIFAYVCIAYTSLRRKQELECEWSELTAQLYMEDKLKRSLQGAQTVVNTAKRAVRETEEQIADVSMFVLWHIAYFTQLTAYCCYSLCYVAVRSAVV
jgi:hypothetical protein